MQAIFQEAMVFFRQFGSNIAEVGSVIPTSAFASAELSSECGRHQGAKRVLEVGAGTGAITAQIAKHIHPGDHFVVCEINGEFATFLRQRFQRDADFAQISAYSEVYEGSVLDLPLDQPFDYIISSIPFNNCPPDFVDAVFAHYQRLLKPNGVLSYIEYIGGRTLKGALGREANFASLQNVLARWRGEFEMRKAVVVRNAPPAWIHHLRFGDAEKSAARHLSPLVSNNQIPFPLLTLDSDFWRIGAVIGFFSLLVRWVAPRSALWKLFASALPISALFFRDPPRAIRQNPESVLAACDGVVLSVERLKDARLGEEEWLRIAVFLSIVDVHVNRAPVAGKVIEIITEEGGYASANTRAAEHNFAQLTVIESDVGRVVVAQRAGLIARKIVNRCKVGMLLAQGDKFGLIRFGSRTDVYLPAAKTRALVKKGERVAGGETVIAQFELEVERHD